MTDLLAVRESGDLLSLACSHLIFTSLDTISPSGFQTQARRANARPPHSILQDYIYCKDCAYVHSSDGALVFLTDVFLILIWTTMEVYGVEK